MTALILREFAIVSQRRSFAIAATAFVVVTSGFALTWPHGITLYSGATLLPQLAFVQQTILAVTTPWVVCRCGGRERG